MASKQVTETTIAKFIAKLLEALSKKYGGDATLNEARVIAHCYLSHSLGKTTSITHISSSLGMPTSTAHRAVTNLIKNGWLRDERDPEDGRRRVIQLTNQAVDKGLWQAGIQWVEEYSE